MKKRNKENKQKNKKNKPSKKENYYLIAIIIAVFLISGAFFLIDYNLSLEPNETNLENNNDFPSSQQGTLEGWIKLEGVPAPKPAILFSSAKLPGLAIVYYTNKDRIIAGTPPMVAENINLFDGKEHNLIYTFEKNGQQALFIDKKVVVSGDYQEYGKGKLTGMVIGPSSNIISESVYGLKIS